MGLFAKAKKHEGWLATSFSSEGVCAAVVKRRADDKPLVQAAVMYPGRKPLAAATLEKMNRDMHAQSYRNTTLLGAGEYQILTLDAPNVPQEELKTAVRWRLKDMLDFPAADATVDVIDIPADKNGPGRSQSLFAVAARNNAVAQRQALYGECKIWNCSVPLTISTVNSILFPLPGWSWRRAAATVCMLTWRTICTCRSRRWI